MQAASRVAVGPKVMAPSAQTRLGLRSNNAVQAIVIDGVFDVGLEVTHDGGLAEAGSQRGLTADQLADMVRRRGGAGRDLRILLPAAAQHVDLLAQTAHILQCDILVPPATARLRYVRAGADGVEVPVPMDPTTGHPVDWKVVQPRDRATTLPGWFDLVGGLVLERSGTVTVPLPGGVALASRSHFIACRAVAATLAPTHPGLTTVAVAVRSGRFLVGDYKGGSTLQSGQELAATLAPLPLYGGDLRLWLVWPDRPAELETLIDNVLELAETSGAVVWAPPVGGRAEIVQPCRDLSARDSSGRVSAWERFTELSATVRRFTSDADGRLMPEGGCVTYARRDVPLVSGPPTNEGGARNRPHEVARPTADEPDPRVGNAFPIDLPIVDDGRPAVYCADGTLHAVASRQMRELLVAAGWRGSNIVLMSSVPPEQAQLVHRYLHVLGRQLGCRMFLAPSIAGSIPIARSEAKTERGPEPAASQDRGWAADPDERAVTAVVDRPPLVPAARDDRSHGVRWLPDRPQVNAVSLDVYVGCPWEAERAAVDGIPSPHLFLLGRLQPTRLARELTRGHLLRLRVEPGGAVDLPMSDVRPPPELQHLLSPTDTYLLPAGWLDRTLIVGAAPVRDGRAGVPQAVPGLPLTICSNGARHGADGLPNDVPLWPRGRLRAAATAYALVPTVRREPAGGWVKLHKHRPRPVPGWRLVQLRIGRGRAIDVAAAARLLAPLSAVRSHAPKMLSQNINLILPRRSFPRVIVRRVFDLSGSCWRERKDVRNLPFSAVLDLSV